MRVRIKKNIMPTLCAALLLGALCVPAFAETDPYYNGEIDSYTGEPVSEAASSAALVQISETTYYDREAHSFVYPTLSGAAQVYANVADGMIVTSPVSISADAGAEITVTRNGAAMEDTELTAISAPGSYIVSAKAVDTGRFLFGFTIVGDHANLPEGYTMPEGFYILDATLDGEETYFERNYIAMEDDGTYDIEYVCPETTLHYKLSTTIDRTPPHFTLDGKRDKNGRFRSAVQIGGLQEGDSVALTRDANEIRFPADGRLTEAGMYQLQVFDAAGNSTTEQFTILVYFDLNSLLFFALVCISLAGVAVYTLYSRKKLKVA